MVFCSVFYSWEMGKYIQYSLEEGEYPEGDKEENGGGEAEREGDDGDGLPHRRPPIHHLLHVRLQNQVGEQVRDIM